MASKSDALTAPQIPQKDQIPQKSNVAAIIRSIAYSIIVNGVLPFVIYIALKNYTHVSDLIALFLSGIPPIVDALVGVIRKHRVDLIAGIVLLSIAVGIVLVLLGGAPKLYLVRESFFTGAFGLVYLVSLLFPRPIIFYFARYFVTGNTAQNVSRIDQVWQSSPTFRRSMRVMTAVWGVVLVAEMFVRFYLVFTLTVPQFLIVSPFIIYGMIGAVTLWTIYYSRRMRADREAERRQFMAEHEHDTQTGV